METGQQEQQDAGLPTMLVSRPSIRSSVSGRGLFDPFQDMDASDSDGDTETAEFEKSARHLEESIEEETVVF